MQNKKNDTANTITSKCLEYKFIKHEGKKGAALPPLGRETPSAADQNFQDTNLGGESEKGGEVHKCWKNGNWINFDGV